MDARNIQLKNQKKFIFGLAQEYSTVWLVHADTLDAELFENPQVPKR